MQAKVHTLTLSIWQKLDTRVVFFIVASALIATFALYAYLINKTVMNVVAREHAKKEIAALSSSIGELEFNYITLRNNITLDIAYAKGFQDAASIKFISRSPVATLSYSILN